MTEIKLPALKENVEVVEVNAVLVSAGDEVAKDQPLMEVQAEKAALDVPSPVAGRVAEVRVKAGDQVKVGQVFCTIEGNGVAPKSPPKEEKAAAPSPPKPAPPPTPQTEPREVQAPRAPEVATVAVTPTARVVDGDVVPAGPATRRLARDLGIDLRQVTGSGRNGRVTQDDVKRDVKRLATGRVAPPTCVAGSPVAAPALPKFESFGPIEREQLTAIRKLTAQQMSLAWSLIPHVTQHDECDITDLESFRKSRDGKGPKLTVTAFALKACAIALKQFPTFNASLDLANQQLVLKRYYHLGVAVDTPRGLLVPVIRDVDKKS